MALDLRSVLKSISGPAQGGFPNTRVPKLDRLTAPPAPAGSSGPGEVLRSKSPGAGDAIKKRLMRSGTPKALIQGQVESAAPKAAMPAAGPSLGSLTERDVVGRRPRFQLPPRPTGPKQVR